MLASAALLVVRKRLLISAEALPSIFWEVLLLMVPAPSVRLRAFVVASKRVPDASSKSQTAAMEGTHDGGDPMSGVVVEVLVVLVVVVVLLVLVVLEVLVVLVVVV